MMMGMMVMVDSSKRDKETVLHFALRAIHKPPIIQCYILYTYQC